MMPRDRRAAVGQFVAMAVALGISAGLCPGARAAATGPNVYLYDMGSDTSAVWAGFARVAPATVYDAKRGCGWLAPRTKPRAYVADFTDALAADYLNVPADLTLSFRQDLPNGEYDVWVLTGSHLSLRYLLYPHALSVQGKVVRRIDPVEEEVFRAVKYDWSKGDDVYDHFIAPRFKWLRHGVSVTDGSLTIGFSKSLSFPLCAIVIAERSVADRVQMEIERIDEQRRLAFHDIWHEVPTKKDPFEPVSPEERRRGYIVSVVNYLDEVLPGSGPSSGASRSEIEIFAARGEQEQASFCVYGLTNLREVSFDVTDLRSADGKVISSSAIERGLVQFTPRRIGHEPRYDISATLILPLRPTFVGSDTCKQFWLTLRVPEDAGAGAYEGTIRISSLDAPDATMQLRLRVLPFQLMVPPVERYFYFGSMISHARSLMGTFDEKKYWESVRAEARYLKENEFCLAQCLINRRSRYLKWKDGKKGSEVIDVDISPTYKIMQILKEENAWPRDNVMICTVGSLNTDFGGHWRQRGGELGIEFCPTPEGRAHFIRAVQIINGKARKEGWPEVAFECGGEYSKFRQQGTRFVVALHSAFKEAGVSSAARIHGPSGMEAVKQGLIDYPEPNWVLMKRKDLPILKRNSKRLWFYNFAEGRFGYGWWCFKHGATRAAHEAGIYFHRQPGNVFDNMWGDFPVGGLPTSLTSLAPSLKLKRMVEGADDYKYLYMLDQLTKKAQASGKPGAAKAAASARAWLDKKLDSVPEGVDDLSGLAEWYNEVRKGVSWYTGDFDKYRWQAAEHIMNLQKELGT